MASSVKSCNVLTKGQRVKCEECGITLEVADECKGCPEGCSITLNCCGKDMNVIEE
ncbi:hypothetical protein Mpsy_2763 [Methanolobus psychrophilus R15]|nr:hypothetical protein Mpsy_2763 [Methanolobus psychrophilus R15]